MKCKISTYDISTRSISNKNCVKQRCHEHIDPPPPPLFHSSPKYLKVGSVRSRRRIEVLVLWIIFQTSPRVGYRRKSQEDAMFSPRFFESSETLELFETFWRDSTASSPCTHTFRDGERGSCTKASSSRQRSFTPVKRQQFVVDVNQCGLFSRRTAPFLREVFIE